MSGVMVDGGHGDELAHWFEFSAGNGVAKVTFEQDPALRYHPVSVIKDNPLPSDAMRGRRIELTGPGAVWMYLHAAYAAVKAGAEEVMVVAPGQIEAVAHPVMSGSGHGPRWYEMGNSPEYGIELKFRRNDDSENGYWPTEALSDRALELGRGSSLLVSGNGSAWMYAAAGAAAARAGIGLVLCDTPREPELLSVGETAPGTTTRCRRPNARPGLALGVLGDPNSGKSMLAKALCDEARRTWPDAWLFDCDAASPTPNWYLASLRAGMKAEADARRRENKIEWSLDLEDAVSRQLEESKRNLSMVVADLPGGLHPKTGDPRRIPDGREVIMCQVDAFIILSRADNPAIAEGWRKALAEHGLDSMIIAELESAEPDSEPSMEIKNEDGLLRGRVSGLDRSRPMEDIRRGIEVGAGELLRHFRYWPLVEAARKARQQAFLAKDGGVRYGAAVLCRDDSVFTAGQYSSYNHITNIHAEQGAILLATMAGKQDILALALATSRAGEIARPCGCCRQVMMEHSSRIGHDFDVVMVGDEGRYEISTVRELLPAGWKSHQNPAITDDRNGGS